MRITKLGHACVRIEHDGRTVVVDPGMFTEPGAADGVDAVLLTHEHPDHWTPEHLAATDAPVFTIAAVADAIRADAGEALERVTVVEPGERFEAAGLAVRAVGELHAVIHPDLPRFTNSGYVLTLGDERVYHPGDALTAPGEDVDVLLAPSSAPWLKASEAIDFVREVGAARNVSIHDRIYTEPAHAILSTHMGKLLAEHQTWIRLGDGADL